MLGLQQPRLRGAERRRGAGRAYLRPGSPQHFPHFSLCLRARTPPTRKPALDLGVRRFWSTVPPPNHTPPTAAQAFPVQPPDSGTGSSRRALRKKAQRMRHSKHLELHSPRSCFPIKLVISLDRWPINLGEFTGLTNQKAAVPGATTPLTVGCDLLLDSCRNCSWFTLQIFLLL